MERRGPAAKSHACWLQAHRMCTGIGCSCPCHQYEERPLPMSPHVARPSYGDPYVCVVCGGHVADPEVHLGAPPP